jgi:hypothetical protein
MDIGSKYKIVERIIQTDDDILLNEIKSLIGLSEDDFWNDLPAEVKQAVDHAKSELDRGGGIPHAQVMAEIKDRFLKAW